MSWQKYSFSHLCNTDYNLYQKKYREYHWISWKKTRWITIEWLSKEDLNYIKENKYF